MNILISPGSYVFSDYFPGGEFQISYAIASRLAQRGNNIYVFAPLKKLKREIPNLTVLEVGEFDFVNPKDYFHYFWDWWKFSIRTYLKAKRLLLEGVPIDVIHHLRPAYPYKFNLCWRLNKPFIYGPISLTWQGYNNEEEEMKWRKGGVLGFFRNKLIDRLNMTFGKYLWTVMLKKADCLMVSVKDAINVIPTEHHSKVLTLPLGVDTNVFKPKLTTVAESFKILFVGNLICQKGLHYLFEAIAQVKRLFPAITLTLLGSGKDERYFRKLCEDLQIVENVIFKGFVPFNEIVSFYQNCNIFCLPSLHEPFGISTLQAMSCGKPVITTNVGGPPHFVENGKSGYLVPPANSDLLATALIDLLSDKDKRGEMGEYNRKLCIEKYDWDKIVDEIEQIYQELLSKQPRSNVVRH